MELLVVSLVVSIVVGAASFAAYHVGHSRGRQDKLDELHELQEEGWLSITYQGNPSKTDKRRLPNAIDEDAQRSIDGLFDEKELVTRSRRDDEERRVDWARHLKANEPVDVDDVED